MDKVTDAVGLTDYRGAELSAKRAAEAASDSVAFSKEQYDDWKEAYEPVQTALSEHFTNLTAESLIGTQLSATQRETQALESSTSASYAQRGLSGSGMEQQALSDVRQRGAETRAAIRSNADSAVANEQMEFLNIGMGTGSQLASNVGSAYNTLSGAHQATSGTLYDNSYAMSQNVMDTATTYFGQK